MISEAIAQLLRLTCPENTRINPSTDTVKILANQLPRVLYSRIDGQRDNTDDGPTNIVKARYQIDVFHQQLAGAEAIIQKLQLPWKPDNTGGINGYKGTLEGTKIDWLYLDTDSFQRAESTEGSNVTIARCIQDFVAIYRG